MAAGRIVQKISFLALLGLTIGLTACGSSATAIPTPSATTAPEAPARFNPSPNAVIASAEIVPAQVSNIGFIVSGRVKQISVNDGELVQSGQPLVVLDTPELDFAVVAAEASLRAAQAHLDTRNRDKYKYKDGYGRVFYFAVPNEVAQIARANVQAAQAELDLAQANLAQGTLTAPFDATVVSVDVTPGELAQVNVPVVTLANLKNLQVQTTDLSERDIPRVKIGQMVNVSIEALNMHISGRVNGISPLPDLVGGDVVYRVTIGLDDQAPGLLWGMTAEVEIRTAP